MTDLEKQVWAGAFVAEFAMQRELYARHGNRTIDDVSGFSCAEAADVYVEKLRAALTGPDREYLMLVTEGAL